MYTGVELYRRLTVLMTQAILAISLSMSPIWAQESATTFPSGELPRVGRVLTRTELEKLRLPVLFDGIGLPPGIGNAVIGAEIYKGICAECHGSRGQGGKAVELVGDRKSLATDFPDRGVAVRWPNVPALFDYIWRAMPPEKPLSLTADEVYSVVAHILVLNELWDRNKQMNEATLSLIEMPNGRNYFSEIEDLVPADFAGTSTGR